MVCLMSVPSYVDQLASSIEMPRTWQHCTTTPRQLELNATSATAVTRPGKAVCNLPTAGGHNDIGRRGLSEMPESRGARVADLVVRHPGLRLAETLPHVRPLHQPRSTTVHARPILFHTLIHCPQRDFQQDTMTVTTQRPAPKLSPAGAAALDALLKDTVDNHVLPATYFGLAGPDGEIYFNCAGDKVFGQPEHGQVNPDTSECCGPYLCLGDGADDNGACLSANGAQLSSCSP